MSDAQYQLPMGEITSFCRRWKVMELALFGSVLRDDFRSDSDIDLLAAFADDADFSLLDHARMEIELEGILGRHVQMLTRRAVEQSTNAIRRAEILSTARSIYRAA
ncbi:MAG: nucleotidyltransferase domain-containing protein [Phycisphaerae bacterium]|nr:nucleotidyltransferase domain-containing protein [Phycisphaerae bacterium]